MTLKEVVDILQAEVFAGADKLAQEVQSGYASDLLSDVMGNAQEGQVWFTLQTHPNVAAVGLLINTGAVVITGGHKPEPDTVTKSRAEGLVLMATPYRTFEAIHALTKAGF